MDIRGVSGSGYSYGTTNQKQVEKDRNDFSEMLSETTTNKTDTDKLTISATQSNQVQPKDATNIYDWFFGMATDDERKEINSRLASYPLPPNATFDAIHTALVKVGREVGVIKEDNPGGLRIDLFPAEPNSTNLEFDKDGNLTSAMTLFSDDGLGRYAVSGSTVLSWLEDFMTKVSTRYGDAMDSGNVSKDDEYIRKSSQLISDLLGVIR